MHFINKSQCVIAKEILEKSNNKSNRISKQQITFNELLHLFLSSLWDLLGGAYEWEYNGYSWTSNV